MAFLTRAEPTKNLHRFYVVRLAPTLFGDWTLLREWGRSGSPGTVRQTSFAHYDDAEKAERQIIKRRLRARPQIIESTFNRVRYWFTTTFSYHILWR
jgi:predicted DNA-binding WGR domain protein